MAISFTINPSTHVIAVSRSSLILTQASPEIRELNINEFRLALKDWEDSEEGIVQPKTHDHNTEVVLSGLTYARIFEILPPYTVEFTDNQYTINCVGGNHNVSDRKVPNQVSLIVNNAAGLISMAAIEFSSYNGGITVDETSSYTGTIFPVGTPQQPVNNYFDALLNAANRGLGTLYVIGDSTLDNSNNFDGMIIVGESHAQSEITVSASASVSACEFYDCTLTGVLDGESIAKHCIVKNLSYINGVLNQCILESGTITLGGSDEAHFLDCWSGAACPDTPVIDMGGSGQELSMRNYNGAIKLVNKTGTERVTLDMNSGTVILSNTVTAGTITARGIGILVDCNDNHIPTGTWNGVTINNQLVTPMLDDIHKVYGLDKNNPVTITQTSRSAGSLSQTITGDGVITTTITRN